MEKKCYKEPGSNPNPWPLQENSSLSAWDASSEVGHFRSEYVLDVNLIPHRTFCQRRGCQRCLSRCRSRKLICHSLKPGIMTSWSAFCHGPLLQCWEFPPYRCLIPLLFKKKTKGIFTFLNCGCLLTVFKGICYLFLDLVLYLSLFYSVTLLFKTLKVFFFS